MATVLVTGGAGYVGSHTVRALLEAEHRVVVLDNLAGGHRGAVSSDAVLVVGDLATDRTTRQVIEEFLPDAVIHFAASIEPGESVRDPSRFYWNNVVNTLRLTDILHEAGNIPIVFSSSCAVYGAAQIVPLTEDHPTNPINPYGETKLIAERLLGAYEGAYGLQSIRLRYFNAAGADPSGEIGADHRHKVHLITVALLTALGKAPAVSVFGNDYATRDGTAIRDYVHVNDLAQAHVLAVDALVAGGSSGTYNLGVGRGFTVTEVLDAVERVTGRRIERRQADRRPGDPPELVADPGRFEQAFGWKAQFLDIDMIIDTAWRWHQGHPDGFDNRT